MISVTASAQVRNDSRHEFISIHTEKDSVMTPIPDLLPSYLFIPRTRLIGIHPWTSAPLPIPVIKVMPVYGFDGSIGFGEYSEADASIKAVDRHDLYHRYRQRS